MGVCKCGTIRCIYNSVGYSPNKCCRFHATVHVYTHHCIKDKGQTCGYHVAQLVACVITIVEGTALCSCFAH